MFKRGRRLRSSEKIRNLVSNVKFSSPNASDIPKNCCFSCFIFNLENEALDDQSTTNRRLN